MAQFPIRETEILGLGSSLITGLTNNAALYPAPPVTPADLQIAFDLTIAARDAATAAEAAALQATTDKELAFQNLTDKMKEDLRYAENTVNMDDDKLKLLGWGGRKAPEALQPPGQARLLEAPREGESRKRGLYQASESPSETGLSPFSAPTDGGKVASYKIERRQRPEGPWNIAGLALETETTLHDQTRGVEWEYRVIAVNKAGEGEASNTVMAVL